MKKAKNNFYVVWVGAKPGIYRSWDECKQQVLGFSKARYKGFKTEREALKAFERGYEEYWGKQVFESSLTDNDLKRIGSPILNSISVDAAWSGLTLDMEYQGVRTETKELLFREGPFEDGTNNVGEFLAIVHGLAYLKKIGSANQNRFKHT
jgi:ribonuclease HI